MARSSHGAAAPARNSQFIAAHSEILSDLHADAESNWLALSALMDLLQGCDPDHPLKAGALLSLLEPIASCSEMLCGDVGMAKHHFSN